MLVVRWQEPRQRLAALVGPAGPVGSQTSGSFTGTGSATGAVISRHSRRRGKRVSGIEASPVLPADAIRVTLARNLNRVSCDARSRGLMALLRGTGTTSSSTAAVISTRTITVRPSFGQTTERLRYSSMRADLPAANRD